MPPSIHNLAYRLQEGFSVTKGVANRFSSYPETDIQPDGSAIVRVYGLWSGFQFCLLLSYLWGLYQLSSLFYAVSEGAWGVGLLPWLVFLVDGILLGNAVPEQVSLVWERYSPSCFVYRPIIKLLRHEFRVSFLKDYLLIERRLFGIAFWTNKINRSDVENTAGIASAYGFYLIPPSSKEIESYQKFKQMEQTAFFVAVICKILLGEPVGPDHRYLCLWVGDAPLRLGCFEGLEADLIQLRLQNLLRGEISAKDFYKQS